MWFYRKVMYPKDADGIANNVDPEQTAPSVQKLRIIMVASTQKEKKSLLFDTSKGTLNIYI